MLAASSSCKLPIVSAPWVLLLSSHGTGAVCGNVVDWDRDRLDFRLRCSADGAYHPHYRGHCRAVEHRCCRSCPRRAPPSRHGAIVAQGPRCGVSRAQNRRQEQVRVVIGAADEPLWAFPPLAAKCLPGQECVAFHDLVSTQSLSKMSLLPVFA